MQVDMNQVLNIAYVKVLICFPCVCFGGVGGREQDVDGT